jgi:hypothetical protein
MVFAQPPPPIAGAGPPGAVECHCGLLRSLRGLWTHGHPVLLDGPCTLAVRGNLLGFSDESYHKRGMRRHEDDFEYRILIFSWSVCRCMNNIE